MLSTTGLFPVCLVQYPDILHLIVHRGQCQCCVDTTSHVKALQSMKFHFFAFLDLMPQKTRRYGARNGSPWYLALSSNAFATFRFVGARCPMPHKTKQKTSRIPTAKYCARGVIIIHRIHPTISTAHNCMIQWAFMRLNTTLSSSIGR